MPPPAGGGRRGLLGLAAPLLLPVQRRAPAPIPGTIVFLGDVMLGRDVSAMLRSQPPKWFWGEALGPLQTAEAVIANLESPITAHAIQGNRTPKWYHFRAEPEATKILRVGRVRMVALANNHILDFGERGLDDTRAHLAAHHIVHAGAGPDLRAASAPAMLDLPSCRVGMLSATDQISEFGAGENRPGTWYITIARGSPALPLIAERVAAMRRDGADLIVLSLHWGPNLRRSPPDAFRDFARAAIASGVDVVHGHSAHLVQGVELAGRGVILYDTGNCIDDYWRFLFVHQEWCFLFMLDHIGGRMRRLRLIPFLNQPMSLRLARGAQRRAMLAHMQALCAAHGTVTEEIEEGLAIALGEPA